MRRAVVPLFAIVLAALTTTGCGGPGHRTRVGAHPAVAQGGDGADEDADGPSNPTVLIEDEQQVTREAVERLRATMTRLSQDNVFALGNEDSTAYGIGWKGEPDRSDLASVCGAPPAVYGWDLFGIELEHDLNGDGVPFALMCRRMQEVQRLGGINTVSWHANNPVSGGDAWDRTAAVAEILPGRPHHETWVAYVDRVADFFLGCRGDSGELLPVIFRPFHEHSGDWFWWGAANSSEEDFVALWRFVVDHLRRERHLENLLVAYSPDAMHFDSEVNYLWRYPGSDYVDVMGMDYYYETDASHLVTALESVVAVAKTQNKWPALTEFGLRGGLSNTGIDSSHWFTQSFLLPLQQSATARQIAYALAWRNASVDHFFVPYPGHPSASDFKALCDDSNVWLLDELVASRTR